MKNLTLMHDEEIIREVAKAYERLRLEKELSEAEVSQRGGVSIDAIHRFKSGKNINLRNFIGIMRGVGSLEMLQRVFPMQESYSPIPQKGNKPKKRIRKKTKQTTEVFRWGEEK